MKRLASEANITPDTRQAKKRKEVIWVSPSSLRNYMLDDPCVDWLKTAGIVSEPNSDSFLSHLLSQGIAFEEKVVQYIREVCEDNDAEFRQIIDDPRDVTFDADLKYAETIQAMEDKVAVIYQGYLQDVDRHLRGIPDLLVRANFLEKFIDNPPKGVRGYVVVDIKFSTLHFRAHENTLRNSGVMTAYKAQVIFYNELLAIVQAREQPYAYLLGRAWKRGNRGTKNCFNRLGVVDAGGVDEEIREKMWRAVEWIRDVKKNGEKWWQDYCDDESGADAPLPRPELYPNMCKSGFYDKEKRRLATDIKEITLIWNCGTAHRAAAHKVGVYSWDDPECTIDNLNIKPTQRGKVIEKMLDFHRSGELIWPRKTRNMQNTLGWKSPKSGAPEYYLDFEFLTNVFDDFGEFPNVGGEEYLYLIGVYSDGKYKSFMMKELTDEEEERNLLAFLDFYEKAPGRLFHWGHIEESLLNRLKHSFPPSIRKRIQGVIDNLVDFTAILRETPILVRGAFGFGLKEYAGAMVKNGQINEAWEGSLRGDGSLVKAKQYYGGQTALGAELIAYNRDDCRITHDIIAYLRNLK